MTSNRLPMAPLLAKAVAVAGKRLHSSPHCPGCGNASHHRVGCLTINDLAEMTGFTTQTVSRWVKDGTIPLNSADGAAVSLGWHPVAIWGTDWIEAPPLRS